MTRWQKGKQTVQFLVGKNRLEAFEADDLGVVADALIGRAALRAAPITTADASWAIEKATAALSGVKELLAASPPERFS